MQLGHQYSRLDAAAHERSAAVLAILGCLSTHILAILGVTAAVAWLGTVEHALVVAVVGGALLTLYTVLRHRRRRPV